MVSPNAAARWAPASSCASESSSRLLVRDLRYRPGETPPWVLDGIDLELRAGECTCVTGPSGAGKTTLLRAIAGLLRGGVGEGAIDLPPTESRGGLDVGLVLQNPDTQLLCTTVGDEVRLGLEYAGLDEDAVSTRARAALGAVGLCGLESRNVETLSMGQKQRVAVAAALALEPRALLLDEPTAQLDAKGRSALVRVLAELKARGQALLVADHLPEALDTVIDRTLQLERGALLTPQGVDPEQPHWPAAASLGQVALQLEDVTLERPDGVRLVRAANLCVHRGERVHLFGANGTGKTTLLRACVGLVAPASGRLRVCGAERARPEQLVGRVSLLMQNPERQFFEDDVAAEVGFVLRRGEWLPEAAAARVAEALADCDAAELAPRSPLSLSYGEQHRVALACALAPRPALLLLDEPFAGLDLERRAQLLTRLAGLARRDGMAMVIASHDPLPWPDWATRSVVLEGGQLVDA
jgi:energy-coupling factor transporter ATP-binding protein EcfA2